MDKWSGFGFDSVMSLGPYTHTYYMTEYTHAVIKLLLKHTLMRSLDLEWRLLSDNSTPPLLPAGSLKM